MLSRPGARQLQRCRRRILKPVRIPPFPYSGSFSQIMQNRKPGGASLLSATVPEYTLLPHQPPPTRFDFGNDGAISSLRPELRQIQRATAPSVRVPDTHGSFPADSLPVEHIMTLIGELRPLGQLHSSFIIAAGTDGLWIIDQHVAHERILFEQVLKQQAAGHVEVQHLLMPVILQLTQEQQIEYARIADELHHSGFETEPFGNRLRSL